MFFNEKGQAFDVFKLLIAAVVAVVILTLLLSIIGQIGVIGENDPGKEGQTIIRDIATKKTTPSTSKKVTFKNGTSINSSGIAEGSGGIVSEDGICVSAGDFEGQDNWETANMVRVTYNGTAAKTVVLHAICDVGKKMADGVNGEDYFERYDPELGSEKMPNVSWSDCSCVNSSYTETCCVIAVKKAV
ncbi:MAG: hypothetical protein PHD95_05690 [Candidatus ainarchaeum sp.]|nr:hypothetical protein [Candidatus ainarchaeum sp.]